MFAVRKIVIIWRGGVIAPPYREANMNKAVFVIAFALQFFLLAGVSERPALSAQTKTRAAQDSLQHEVTVTVKLVQVYVTDPKGEPARDLKMSEFILYDNGKLQTITGFEKHFLATPEVKVEEAKLAPPRDVASLMNRKFIFLFDFGRNDLEGIMKSRKAALEFMDTKVQPGDEVAIFSYISIRRLALHEYLTSDHQKIRDTIKKIKGVPGVTEGWMSFASLGHSIMGMELLSQGGSQEARVFRDPNETSASEPGVARRSGSSSKSGITSASGDARLFAEAMTNLAKAFRHIPGQKNIVLFSRGFGAVSRPDSPIAGPFQLMAKELASANSPVFAVNTMAGVFPESSLEYLSKMTGGKYFNDINYYSEIAGDLQDATSNYYVLSYSVASTWDGKFHDIKVEVKRPGYRVYAQRGYFNPLPFNQLSAVEKHLHLLDLALGERAYFEQHLNFPIMALPFSDKKEANTILISEIPVQRIREAVGDNTEFIGLVFDQNKTIVDSKRVEMNWGSIKGEKICQYGAAGLPPGRHDCRIVIRNLENGNAAVAACSVEIPESAVSDLKLYPPLLLVAGEQVHYLHVSGQEKAGAAKEVSISEVYPFPPKEFSPLIGELEHGANLLCAAARCECTGRQQPVIQFSASLQTEEIEQKIPLTVNVLSAARQEETYLFILEFELPELQAGKYSLHLVAWDSGTKSSSEAISAFSVKSLAPQKD
jgi:VWFA-related protein